MEPAQQRRSALSTRRTPALSPLELIGRRGELHVIAELLDQGWVLGAALVVRGDPGIGKSALLGAARREARARGFRVLAAVGVQSEAQLPFAGLHQLLRPVLASVRDLPPVQREASPSAFGLFEGPWPEPFLIALVAANRLGPQSQEALTFVAHRAAGNPIVVIGAMRTGHPGPFLSAGLPELRGTRRRRCGSAADPADSRERRGRRGPPADPARGGRQPARAAGAARHLARVGRADRRPAPPQPVRPPGAGLCRPHHRIAGPHPLVALGLTARATVRGARVACRLPSTTTPSMHPSRRQGR
jgi:hypothetical protein